MLLDDFIGLGTANRDGRVRVVLADVKLDLLTSDGDLLHDETAELLFVGHGHTYKNVWVNQCLSRVGLSRLKRAYAGLYVYLGFLRRYKNQRSG